MNTTPDNTRLATSILRGDYNLLIGSEAVLRTDTPCTNGTGDSLIWFYTNAFNKTRDEEDPAITQITDRRISKVKNVSENIRQEYSDILNTKNDDYVSQWFEPSLRSLLKAGDFRNIFTTCIDDILETELRHICEAENRKIDVYNFMNSADISAFITNRQSQTSTYGKPTAVSLVYLYGKLDRRIPYVLNDDDAIKAISNLITKKESAQKGNFAEFLFSRPMLSIGCHCDDWRFRFFWYAINGGLPHKGSDNISDTVVYTTPDIGNDPLAKKLDAWKVDTYGDSRLFMSQLTDQLLNTESLTNLLHQRKMSEKYIFLSYTTRDFRLAYEWFEKLTAKGFNVWIDHARLSPGREYSDKIDEALKNCTIFMPLLSPSIADDLSKNDTNHYYVTEWKQATSLNKVFFPVNVGNYDYTQPYHNLFRELCNMADTEKDLHIKSVRDIAAIANELNARLLNTNNQ